MSAIAPVLTMIDSLKNLPLLECPHTSVRKDDQCLFLLLRPHSVYVYPASTASTFQDWQISRGSTPRGASR